MKQQTIWQPSCAGHDPVMSYMKDGTVIKACRKCGMRLVYSKKGDRRHA